MPILNPLKPYTQWGIAGLSAKRGERRFFNLSIRAKLLLISAVLFVVPWAGVQYIQDMENFLRLNQQTDLLGRAQIVAAVLQGKAQMFKPRVHVPAVPEIDTDAGENELLPDAQPDAQPEEQPEEPAEELSEKTAQQATQPVSHLYVRPLRRAIQLDGYMDDWLDFDTKAQAIELGDKTGLQSKYFVGSYKKYLYIMLQIIDDHLVYRKANSLSLDKSDHIKIVLRDKEGQLKTYIIATLSPGWINAQRVELDEGQWRAIAPEYSIKGEWQETREGYNIELRVPLALVGDNLSFFIADVDDSASAEIESTIGSSPSPDAPGTVIIPSPEVESLLNRVIRPASRTWVVDKHNRVLAVAGDLKQYSYPVSSPVSSPVLSNKRSPDNRAEKNTEAQADKPGALRGAIRYFYQLLLKQPADNFKDDLSYASYLQDQSVQSALQGKAATSWRETPDKRVRILTASYPVIENEKVIGAIAIEETSNAILILQNRAMEILINLSVLTFFITVIVLLGYATRLSVRIMRLRDETERAISAEGRIERDIKRSTEHDEIGDLSRSFSDMLARLGEYNRYLESMAGKLSHELRTPITVVRSSLDNLTSAQTDDERQTYIQRASEGVARLSDILTRMSEATRLEQTLQSERRSNISLKQLVEGCVSGYRMIYPQLEFALQTNGAQAHNASEYPVHGAPELLAQLLDKLVSNAVDFHLQGSAIRIRLLKKSSSVQLSVINQGPCLPEYMRENLFESMVSVRDKRDKQPHLGLGLYIVRLIAEFHQAKVEALNTPGSDGVEIRLTFPLK
ncbi:Sensor histidine kinase [hydrothermal vent metagenome]|uniref:histidine kinase n=1 Tax=hydrothermal vent metagenome TaxID=652676 RepID=A0A3B0XWC2_9ZZZZ